MFCMASAPAEQFRLGDPIKIQVVRVDLDKGEIDFMLP